MALKLSHRGHSSRLETLIEKIQQSNYIKDSPGVFFWSLIKMLGNRSAPKNIFEKQKHINFIKKCIKKRY